MGKWYGSVQNRIEENRMYCETIEVGTGVTEYFWSDRHPYEVTKVIDQKHVYIRPLDHELDGEPMSNRWRLVSNPENPEHYLTKRGKYWYYTNTWTTEDLDRIENDIDLQISFVEAGGDYGKVRKNGRQTTYRRANVSFGVAEYYYDYEF